MLREYEFTVITKGDLNEDENNRVLSRYEEIAKREGGEILGRDLWSGFKLSYPVKKAYRGHYVFYDLATTKESVAEIERLIRFDEGVLRYMFIKKDDKVDIEKRKAEIRTAKLTVTQN